MTLSKQFNGTLAPPLGRSPVLMLQKRPAVIGKYKDGLKAMKNFINITSLFFKMKEENVLMHTNGKNNIHGNMNIYIKDVHKDILEDPSTLHTNTYKSCLLELFLLLIFYMHSDCSHNLYPVKYTSFEPLQLLGFHVDAFRICLAFYQFHSLPLM